MNNTREIERKIYRTLTKRGFYLTVKGVMNNVQVNGQFLFISTTKKQLSISLSRNQIRRAIRYFQVYRTAIREDMEQFTAYSSALFGILIEAFKKVSKLQKLGNGLFRLSLCGSRFYASGLERDPFLRKELKRAGGQYVLYNYYQLLQTPNWLDTLEKEDLYCLIDSGSFSYMKGKQKKHYSVYQQQELFSEEILVEQYIEGYANFINQYKDHERVIGFFPFDCIGDPKQTKLNYEKLKSLTDARIFPVWQITDSIEELEHLCEEEPILVAIGGAVPFLSNRINIVRSIMKKVFMRFSIINFHLLGISNELLIEFPCFSFDGTAFLNARKSDRQKKIYIEDGTRIPAPPGMTTLDVIKQNLEFLIKLESFKRPQQLVLPI